MCFLPASKLLLLSTETHFEINDQKAPFKMKPVKFIFKCSQMWRNQQSHLAQSAVQLGRLTWRGLCEVADRAGPVPCVPRLHSRLRDGGILMETLLSISTGLWHLGLGPQHRGWHAAIKILAGSADNTCYCLLISWATQGQL